MSDESNKIVDFKAFIERGKREGRELLRDDLLRGRGGAGSPIGATVNGVRGLRGQIGESAGRIGLLARAAFRRDRVVELPTTETDPGRRFAIAVEHYGRDEAYVRHVQNTKYKNVLLYLGIAAALLALNVATARGCANAIIMVGHLAPIAPALTLAWCSAFYNWQLRTRRMDGVGAFFQRPDDWWPEPAPVATASAGRGRGIATALGLAILVGAASLFGSSSPAAAQTTATSADPGALLSALPSSDLWGHLLSFVLPGVGPVAGQVTPIANGIASAFGTMIALLMFVGAAWLAWQTIEGIVEVAHTGEALTSRRFHATWAPIRVCYAFASLAPVAGGYCLLQVMIVWVAVASGQLGDAMWSSFVGGLNGRTIAAPSLPQSTGLVRDDLALEVCFAQQAAVDASMGVPAPTWPASSVQGAQADSWHQDWSYLTSFWTSTASTVAPSAVHQRVWDYGQCGRITGVYADAATGAAGTLASGQISAVDTLRASLRTVAQQIVASTESGSTGVTAASLDALWTQVASAKNAFDTTLQTATTNFAETSDTTGLQAFQQASQQAGWVAAGAYYMTIARINTAQVDAARTLPTVSTSSADSDRLKGPLGDALYGTTNRQGSLEVLSQWWSAHVDSATSTLSADAASAGTEREGGVYGALRDLGSPTSGLQQSVLRFVQLSPGSYDGMQQMIDVGDYIVGAGETVVGGTAILKAASLFTPVGRAATVASDLTSGGGGGAGALGGPLSFSTLLLGGVGLALLGAGLYDSLILPMTPFLLYTMAVMSILVIVVEGVCAAPIWAMLHAKLSGQEVLEREQKAGYQILFNLLFRIPLTLLGLFFSLQVFDGGIWLLSVTLIPAMSAATSDSLFGILGTVVYCVMIAAASWAIANRSFALIHQVPDRVTRWFGASADGHGDEHGHVAGVVGTAQSGGGQGAGILRQAVTGVGKPGGAPGPGGRPGADPVAAERAAQDRTAALLADVDRPRERPRRDRQDEGDGEPA